MSFYFKEKEFRIQIDSNTPNIIDLSSYATDTTKFLTIYDPEYMESKKEMKYRGNGFE
jgi:hypothetical protein